MKKNLLSLKNLEINFKVRGRVLNAIRGISLDIYENESIAIVGESGSGKSVLTKAIFGMLDSNGYIANGDILFYDDELSRVSVKKSKLNLSNIDRIKRKLKSFLNSELIDTLAKEIWLTIERYSIINRIKYEYLLIKELKEAASKGIDIFNNDILDEIFDKVVFRVRYLGEDINEIYGKCKINLSKIEYTKDWQQIRGSRIATIFQDPMTSLNPIVTIGNQITSIIIKHQKCSVLEAKNRAIELMDKVGIPNPYERFNDYPFQYSGGMRQRIVIAIALSCQPKILICDEPTTALDVTIQAQILKLIQDLQKEFKYTIIFITHDLGVVANIADRVAVMYAGQIVELGNVEEIFYNPQHPYTWALLQSLPQLANKGDSLYYISGTPPSLYQKIIGDPFAPRNKFCMKIDIIKEPPMFKVSETHYAKTWLLDPRAPKIDKPETIKNLHEKLMEFEVN